MTDETTSSSVSAEKVLIGLLPEAYAMKTLAREGLRSHVIPTEELRPVYEWAVEYYSTSGKAPTVAVLKDRFGVDFFSDLSIDMDDEPEESVEWAIESLKSNHARVEMQKAMRQSVMQMREAAPENRVQVLNETAASLTALSLDLTPVSQISDLRETGESILHHHDIRAAEGGGIRGMTMGLADVDEHMGGIHPGEICVFAAPAKMGKSFLATHAARRNWEDGRPGVIFPLENSAEMTRMRIACQALAISYTDLDQGRLSDTDRNRLVEWVEDVLKKSDVPLWIVSPEDATPEAMLQQALSLEAEWVIIDQLTFMESSNRNLTKRHEIVLDVMRRLKRLAQRPASPLPILMAHQINRDGIKNAEKTGWLSMTDMAESSEVERACDFLYGLYGSPDMIASGEIQLLSLAARRVPGKSFDLHWHPAIGGIGVRQEVNPDDFDV